MTPTYLIRFAQALVLATALAVMAVPTAALGGSNAAKPVPDWFERYVAAHPYGHGVIGASTAPDWFERYAAAHKPAPTFDGRSPDTLDAAGSAQTQVTQNGLSPSPVERIIRQENAHRNDSRYVSGRSQQHQQTVEIVASGGFDWKAAGIGALAGAAMIVLLASVTTALAARRRHRVQAT